MTLRLRYIRGKKRLHGSPGILRSTTRLRACAYLDYDPGEIYSIILTRDTQFCMERIYRAHIIKSEHPASSIKRFMQYFSSIINIIHNRIHGYRPWRFSTHFRGDSWIKSPPVVSMNRIISTSPARPFRFESWSVRNDVDLSHYAVSICGDDLQFASERCKHNARVVSAAVTQNGLAFQYAAAVVRNNPDIVSLAVAQNPDAFEFADASLQDDRRFVMKMVTMYGGAILKHAASRMSSDSHIIMAAVCKEGTSLKWADSAIRDDEAVVKMAVIQNGLALEFASDRIKGIYDIISNAVVNNGHAIQFASDDQRDNMELVSIAVRQTTSALQHASSRIQNAYATHSTRRLAMGVQHASRRRGAVSTHSKYVVKSPSY